MKNTVKLFVAAFVVAIAASCGGTKTESTDTKDTVVAETPVPAPDTTTTSADTTATSADTTAVK